MEDKNIYDSLLLDSQAKVQKEVTSFIIDIVQMYYGLEENYYLQRSRKHELVLARQVAMYLIKQHTTSTLLSIGKRCGRDHATALHSIRKIKDYLWYNQEIKGQVKEIEQIIKFKSMTMSKDRMKDYFFLDLNSFSSIELKGENKSIIMTGFTEKDAVMLSKIFTDVVMVRHHEKTGMYLLEKRKKNDELRTRMGLDGQTKNKANGTAEEN